MVLVCKIIPGVSTTVTLFTALFFLISASISYAEKFDYFSLSPELLLGVEVISVSKKYGKLLRTPAAFYVVTNEDIIRSGVKTIPGALRLTYSWSRPMPIDRRSATEIFGSELLADWDVNKSWKLTAMHSHLQVYVHFPAVPGVRQEGEEGMSPVHQACLRSTWNISETLTLDAGLYYTDQVLGSNIDNYLRVDLNPGWQLHDNARREFNGVTSVHANKIERSVFGKLTWQL